MKHQNLGYFAGIALFCAATCTNGVFAQDPFTRIPQYPGVTVIALKPAPVELRALPPSDCPTQMCLPSTIVVTNVSERVVAKAWILVRLPGLDDDAAPYGIPVLYNNDGRSDALRPGASVELTIEPHRVDALKRHLATSGRTLRSLTKAVVMVTHVEFEDGGYFTPAGYSARER